MNGGGQIHVWVGVSVREKEFTGSQRHDRDCGEESG